VRGGCREKTSVSLSKSNLPSNPHNDAKQAYEDKDDDLPDVACFYEARQIGAVDLE